MATTMTWRNLSRRDFTIHSADPDEQIRGIDGVKQFYTELRQAFPDIHFTIDSQIAEADKVVTQWTARGTHKGVFRGIQPTGRKFTMTSIDIDRFVDGKVVECWPSMDELGLLRQLGVVPGNGRKRKRLYNKVRPMATIEIDTLIIGGGQAGLATSYYLTRQGHRHVVLEQSEKAAAVWRNRSWDSFTLVTPNWAFKMPGGKNNGVERDAFMPRHKVIEFFEDYAITFGLPVTYKTQVISVTQMADGMYHTQTNLNDYKSRNVVVATGFFQHPKIPGFSNNLSPDIHQLHSSHYRNPKSLPEGSVLVVGSGQSGCQIAEELLHAGRKVFLSTGRAGRAPRRYRGKDIIEWLELMGFFNLTPEQLPPGMGKFDGIPHLTGRDGGHTINLHKFAQRWHNAAGSCTGCETQYYLGGAGLI